MTIRYLRGLYSGPGVGYSVSSGFAYSALSITSTGTVLGAHGTNAPPSTGSGSANGGPGFDGLLVNDNGVPITNSGLIRGGVGGNGGTPANSGVIYGTKGGHGGYGVSMQTGGYLHNLGSIIGGAAGASGGGMALAGNGGGGIDFAASGDLNNAGVITGGAGHLGSGSTTGSGKGVAGGGSDGGWGVIIHGGSVNNSGTIRGGAGGAGGQGTIGAGGGGGGGGDAVYVQAATTLSNTGLIIGGTGGAGGAGQTSSGSDARGGYGVLANAALAVSNAGTILGGAGPVGDDVGTGVFLYAGGSLINTSTGLIEGLYGVQKATTLTNFGTIEGTRDAVVDVTRFIVEVGSTLIGKAQSIGTLELTGGTGTITGLGATATVSGAIAMTCSGVGSYQLDAGGAWALAGYNSLPENKVLTADSGLTLAAGTSLVIGNSTVRFQGVIANAGRISNGAGAKAHLRVLAGGATLSGGGTVAMCGAPLTGASATTTLTNVDNTIVGFGQLGGASLTLINQSKGVIDAKGSALTVDTSGATLINSGLMEATPNGELVVASTTVNNMSGGTIMAAGGVVELQGADILGGTLVGPILARSGNNTLDGTKSTVALTGLVEVLSGFSLDLVGSIANSGKLGLYGGKLIIGAAGAALSGKGHLNLSSSTANLITASAAGATLTNVDDTIVGAGTIGGGTLSLVNEAGGLIFNSLASPLVINTGTHTVINAGYIDALAAGGGVTVISAVNNTGHLWAASGGTLTLDGLVTGGGVGNINGGTLVIAKAFAETVAFAGTGGVLELERSAGFTGFVLGLDSAGSNSLDLVDIAFTSGVTTATYSGSTTSGTLTVTDGVHTAHIKLVGNYATAGFTLSNDGNGGTTVIDPAPARTPAAITQAMATFQIGAPTGQAGTPAWQVPKLPLVHAHG